MTHLSPAIMFRPLTLCVAGLLLAGCPAAPEAPLASQRRIVSQTIDSDEVLWALGEAVRKDVVGVSTLVDDARYSTLAGTWPASVPRIDGKTEALLAARPTQVFFAGWSNAHARELVEKAGIDVVVLDGYGGFEDYRTRVKAIAAAVGATDEGDRVVREFDGALAKASAPAGPTGPARPTVVSFSDGNVAGAGTTFADEARAAGLQNLPSAHELRGHQPVGLEQLTSWQPAFIVIACEDDCAATEDAFAAQPGIAATPAGRDEGVIAIEPRLLFATGASMVEVVAKLRARTASRALP